MFDKCNNENYVQFSWRPRPPSLLSPEKEEEILKNLKKYSKKYEIEDQDISVLLSEQECEKRKQLKEEWERWVNEWKRDHEEKMLRDREASDVEEAEQVEVEELVHVTEEILPDVGIF
ncbi:putative eukaryotic translation initiation factor 3 subunit B [Helianthus annuus]|nr:putative eukaryotic translation initiation factor 3 subunit B [Helianthus annuus]